MGLLIVQIDEIIHGISVLIAASGMNTEDAAFSWAEQVQAWGPVAGVVVAVVGIFAIYSTVPETRRQQRTQSGPYVRVDLGVAERPSTDFEPPKAHYTNTSNVVDLDESMPEHQKVIISAWLSNYQACPTNGVHLINYDRHVE